MRLGTRRALLISVAALLVVIAAAWIVATYYFDSFFSRIAERKIVAAVESASQGKYQLSFRTFAYSHGEVLAKGVDFRRIGYTKNDRGVTVRRIYLDSLRITGVNWINILLGRPISLDEFDAHGPRLVLSDIESEHEHLKLLPDTVHQKRSNTFSIAFETVRLPNAGIYGPYPSSDHPAGLLSVTIAGFHYPDKSGTILPFYSRRIELSSPYLEYADSDASHAWRVRGLAMSSSDSLFRLASLRYTGKNASGSDPLAFQAGNIRATGVNYSRLLGGSGVSLRDLTINSPAIDIRSSGKQRDTSKHRFSQRYLVKEIPIPVRAKHISIENGSIQLHEATSLLAAEHVTIQSTNFNIRPREDSSQPLFSKDVEILAPNVRYSNKKNILLLKGVRGDVANSLLTANEVSSSEGGSHYHINNARAEGINFPALVNGKAIALNLLEAKGWVVDGSNGRKTSTSPSDRHGHKPFSQEEIAHSVSIPIEIKRISLPNGRVRLYGNTPIDTHNINVQAFEFHLDPKARSFDPLFSRDVTVEVPRFNYNDRGEHLAVSGVRASTRSGSIVAHTIDYPNNGTEYSMNDLRAAGIDVMKLLNGNGIYLHTLGSSGWSIVRTAKINAASESDPNTSQRRQPLLTLPIVVNDLSFPVGTIRMIGLDSAGKPASRFLVRDISFHGTDIRYDPKKASSRLTFGQALFGTPSMTYDDSSGFYRFEVLNLHGNLHDAFVTADTLGYIPKYPTDQWAALHQYATGRKDFQCFGLRASGVDASGLLDGKGIEIQNMSSTGWLFDYYKDEHKPGDKRPIAAHLLNDFARSVKFPLTVHSIELDSGYILFRELAAQAHKPGIMTFDRLNLKLHSFSTDHTNALYSQPTQFDFSGIYMGESQFAIAAEYPLQDSEFNMTLHGVVGPFDATRLNSFLPMHERKKLLSGQFDSASLAIAIVNGNATTTLTPLYHDLKIKVMPPNPEDKPDIEEDVKTFITNAFIIRKNNPEKGEKPVTAVTTRARKEEEQLIQFIWFAIRQALGKVVGGFS